MRAALLAGLLALLAAVPTSATTYDLDITTAGPVVGGSVVVSSPAGILCPSTCTHTFTAGTVITLTQTAPSTMTLLTWGGAPCNTNTRSCTFTLNDDTSLAPSFAPLLNISIYGTGIGSVTAPGQPACFNTNGKACNRDLVYPMGSQIVLTRSTGSYSAFTGWTSSAGGCATASTCTVTALNTYTTVVATFTASSAVYPLMVSIVPPAGGSVTSSPSGIWTSSGVYHSTFTANASVTLTTAAARGYRFGGWANGGCSSATTPCVITSTSPLQGLGGKYSPAAFFFPVTP